MKTMLNHLLNIIPASDSTIVAVTGALDSAKNVILDTTGKSAVEKTLIETMNKVSSTPADQLLASLGEKALQFGLKVVAALLIYILGGYVIKWVKKILNNLFSKKKTEPAIVSFTMSLVTAALWVIVIIVAVGTLGVETTSLAALLAAGGMAIGMALSGTVQNFAGGIMILAFKPFKVGDYIEAQGFAGTVSEMNITSTKLTTVDNRVIILPNGTLSNGTINNYSKMEYRRVDFTVGVEYGSDADKVKEILLGIAAADKRVLNAAAGAPADPFVGLVNLNASSVDFTFRLWAKAADYWGVFFETYEKIYKVLPENGINFPFPQMTVHMDR